MLEYSYIANIVMMIWYLYVQVFCIAALVAAVVTVSAITEVEDYFNDYGREYEHADSYSRGAKWMIIVAILGSIYHFLMVFLRYLYINSRLKSLFHFYAYLVSSQLTTLIWNLDMGYQYTILIHKETSIVS